MQEIDNDDFKNAYKHCVIMINESRVVKGNRIFVPEKNGYSWDYAVQEGSVKQAKVRNQYGRYLSFKGRTLNKYSGTSGYSIPGKPGYINCNWGSRGSWGGRGGFYGNNNFIGGGYRQGGSYSGGGQCYGEEGTDPIKIEGKAGGVESNVYDYLLDCKDKTFDRKGDIADADGVFKKGWMKTERAFNARFVEKTYCPILKILPKEISTEQ